jgi:hypothetical protein
MDSSIWRTFRRNNGRLSVIGCLAANLSDQNAARRASLVALAGPRLVDPFAQTFPNGADNDECRRDDTDEYADDERHDAHDEWYDADDERHDAHDEWHDAHDDVQDDLHHDADGHEMRDDAHGRRLEGHVHGGLSADDDHDEHGYADDDDVWRHGHDGPDDRQDGEGLTELHSRTASSRKQTPAPRRRFFVAAQCYF